MPRNPAPLFALTAAVSWGAMFPIARSVLGDVDAFNLTAIRYAVASLVFLALLRAVEGRAALRTQGRTLELFALGTVGFAGFNLLSYLGLEHTEPQNAALVVATTPLIAQLVAWARTGVRPTRTTLALSFVALAGVALVISKGDPSQLASGGVGGELLVLVGAIGWVIYSGGAAGFGGWSPLRYTALSASLGALAIIAITAVADLAGFQRLPSAAAVGENWPAIAYIIVFGAVIAVLAWNAGVNRLGLANGALFMNLVPITTFAIQLASGYDPAPAELVGAGLTVAALVAANLLARRPVGADASAPGDRAEAETVDGHSAPERVAA